MSNSSVEVRDWHLEPEPVLLKDAEACLDLAWSLLGHVYHRGRGELGNFPDNSRVRDLLRRVMDAKLEASILRIRSLNRSSLPAAVSPEVPNDPGTSVPCDR